MRRLQVRPRFWGWAALFGIGWGLAPLLFWLADMERGFDATGGEALIPLIPVIALTLTMARKNSTE
jgi:hypothetical protein